MRIGLLGPFSLKARRGNSIRILLQAEGLWKNSFSDFTLYSYEPSHGTPYPQEKIGGKFFFKKFPLWQKLERLSVDIVHAHHYFGAMILKQPYIVDMPSFMSLQTESVYSHSGGLFKRRIMRHIFNPLFQKRIEKKVILGAKKVIAASQSIKSDLIKHIPELDPEKIAVIYNTVKTEDYPQSSREDFVIGVSASDFRDPMDSGCIDTVIEIALKTKFRFKVAGAAGKGQIKRMSRVSGIEYLGPLPYRDYISFLNAISVFLVPYSGFRDFGGSKFKLLEAAACGLPVVSTSNGAIGFEPLEALLIGDTTAQIIEKLELLKDGARRKQYGAKLREIIRRDYNYVTEARKLIEIYESVS